MANDDVNLNRPIPSSAQSGSWVDGASAPPPSSSPSPHVDIGDGGNVVYGGRTDSSGPTLDLPQTTMSTSAFTMMLYSVQEKMTAARIKSAKSEVQTQTADAQKADKKRVDDIKKVIAAQRKAKHHSKLGMIFGWVGVALTYVAAVVVTVASGGLAAAPVLAAAVLMTGLMIAQETGGIHKLAKALGLGKKGEMGLMIGLTAAILVVSLVSVVATGGAAAVSVVSSLVSAVSRITATSAEIGAGVADMAAAGAETGDVAAQLTADTTEAMAESTEISADAGEVSSSTVDTSSEMTDAEVETGDASSEATQSSEGATQSTSEASDADTEASQGEKGDEIAKNSASRTQKVAARMGNVVNIASAGTSVGSGASGIQTAQDEHAASMAEADSMDQQAFLAQVQSIQAATIRKLRKILEDMQANTSTVFSIVSSSNKVTEEISKGTSV